MTKADLVSLVAKKSGIPYVRAEAVVDTIFDAMAAALLRNDRIEIRDFGTFVNRSYEAYKGRNPRTGKVIDVEKKRLPHFKAGKVLKERIKG